MKGIAEEKQRYEKWNILKQEKNFEKDSKKPFFREGEIRWIYMGINIKSEIFGKSDLFTRPVLVFKKIYGHSALIIPLTSQEKKGSYYFSFQDSHKITHCAIFSQIKYIDGIRIGKKVGTISRKTFSEIQEKYIAFIKNIPSSQ